MVQIKLVRNITREFHCSYKIEEENQDGIIVFPDEHHRDNSEKNPPSHLHENLLLQRIKGGKGARKKGREKKNGTLPLFFGHNLIK